MANSLMIDTEAFKEIKSRFEKNVALVNEKFDNMCKIMNTIDGNNEVWKGKTARKVNEKFALFSSNFPNIIEKLNNYNKYLQNVIDNYTKAEESINHSLDNNEGDLKVE